MGVEPTRYKHENLNLACLPIPSLRQIIYSFGDHLLLAWLLIGQSINFLYLSHLIQVSFQDFRCSIIALRLSQQFKGFMHSIFLLKSTKSIHALYFYNYISSIQIVTLYPYPLLYVSIQMRLYLHPISRSFPLRTHLSSTPFLDSR